MCAAGLKHSAFWCMHVVGRSLGLAGLQAPRRRRVCRPRPTTYWRTTGPWVVLSLHSEAPLVKLMSMLDAAGVTLLGRGARP